MDKEYKKSLEIRKTNDGQFDLDVDFNASDNLSKNLIKASMESKMSEIYMTLYTQFDNIKTASIGASFPMRDKYGNESDPIEANQFAAELLTPLQMLKNAVYKYKTVSRLAVAFWVSKEEMSWRVLETKLYSCLESWD